MRLTAYAGAAAVALTLLVWLVPQIDTAYRSASLHVAFETTSALVALLAVMVVVGRQSAGESIVEAGVAAGLAALALTSLVGAVAAIVGSDRTYLGWTILAGSSVGGIELAVASVAQGLRRRRHSAAIAVAATIALYAAGAVVLWAIQNSLPEWHSAVLTGGSNPHVQIVGGTAALAVSAFSTATFTFAALGFALASSSREGILLRWLGPATALGAVARFNYVLFPSRTSSWIYLGDVLRIGFYVVLLGAALAEIRAYQRRAAEHAVLEERRKLARHLHDGLAQELAFVVQQAKRAGDAPLLEASAQRALDESRRVISVLTNSAGESLGSALQNAAAQVAQRYGLRLTLDLEDAPEADPADRETLVRVVREAIDNAARHGHATSVHVACVRDGELHLLVRDDGEGLGNTRNGTGFALRRLREELALRGGTLDVRSGPDGGAIVEAVLS